MYLCLIIPLVPHYVFAKRCFTVFTDEPYCYLCVVLDFDSVSVYGYLLAGLPVIYMFAAVLTRFCLITYFGLSLLELCNKTVHLSCISFCDWPWALIGWCVQLHTQKSYHMMLFHPKIHNNIVQFKVKLFQIQ